MAIKQFDEEFGVNLGYPLASAGGAAWVLNVLVGYDSLSGRRQFLPVAFSPYQAREIARRIMAHFGPEPVRRAE